MLSRKSAGQQAPPVQVPSKGFRITRSEDAMEHQALAAKTPSFSLAGVNVGAPLVDEVLRSSGQALAPHTKAFFESRYAHDFSAVRTHRGGRESESARAVNALAYTVGEHIVFGADAAEPTTSAGHQLLAHELAHVVQQSRGFGAPSVEPHSDLERDAERAASAVALGGASVEVTGRSRPGLARVFAPNSLDHQIDPPRMSTEEIRREIELITRWLKDNANGAEANRLKANLAGLKTELDRRPQSQGTKPAAGKSSAELKFSVSSKDAAPAAPPQQSAPRSDTANTPPPEANRPSIESLLPAPRETKTPDIRGLNLLGLADPQKPADEKPPSTPQEQPKPKEVKKDDDDKPGLGLQTGTGTQAGLRAPHGAFQYVQFSAEYSNAYVVSLEGNKLPSFFRDNLKSVSFLGEPGWTLQLHALGDKPGTLDLQFLFKLIQLSLNRVDISLVGGAQWTDIAHKWDSSRFAPLAGLESETKIVGKGPLSLTWVLDGLAALPQKQTAPDRLGETQPRPGRWVDGQFSGELRLKLLF